MKKTYEPIYKFDSKKKLRIWYMEQDGSRHRTIAGIDGGGLIESGWTQCAATNLGKANERDPVAQATLEIAALYEKKLTREYHRSIELAKGGAHFFKPMLAEKYVPFQPGYAQPKLDGVRCIISADGMWSRQGKPIMGAPHIFETARPLFANGCIKIDGELYNHELKHDFDTLISIVRQQSPTGEQLTLSAKAMQYHAYDLPSHTGLFDARSIELYALVNQLGSDMIQFVPTYRVETAEQFDNYHGQWLELGYEGSIWRANTQYENKRTKALQKRKEFQDAEFEVVRIEEGLGNWSGLAKRVVCRLPDGREFGAGIKGSQTRAAELLHETHKVVTIKYFALTPDGIPRFPVAIQFHGAERAL